MSDLQELIRDARKELRKSSGLPLSAEEQNEDARKAALKDLRLFVVSRLGVQAPDSLCGRVAWTDNGPALIMQASGCVFHLRKADDSELIYRLAEFESLISENVFRGMSRACPPRSSRSAMKHCALLLMLQPVHPFDQPIPTVNKRERELVKAKGIGGPIVDG